MNERLRKYIDNLFIEAPETKKTVELKEEILQNITDKYFDLLAEGKTEEAAYNIAIASIGDVNELIENLKKGTNNISNYSEEVLEAARRKSALITAISVALYILSPILIITTGDLIGVVLFLFLIAVATSLLIYNNMTKPKYIKMDDTIVEEFKEWKENRDKKGLNAINSAIWSLTTTLYLVISFLSGAWHITWIIFIISGCITSIIKATYDLKGADK